MFLYLAMIDSDADKSKFEILYSEYKNLCSEKLLDEQEVADIALEALKPKMEQRCQVQRLSQRI